MFASCQFDKGQRWRRWATLMTCSYFAVLRRLRYVNGPWSRQWHLQMRHGCGARLQMGVLWYVLPLWTQFFSSLFNNRLMTSRNYPVLVCHRHHLHRALHADALGESLLRGEFSWTSLPILDNIFYHWLTINSTTYCLVQNTTVTERAKNFHSVQYLLVHGTADGKSHHELPELVFQLDRLE